MIPLGAPIFATFDSPESWAQAHLNAGWRAAFWPHDTVSNDAQARDFARAAAEAGLIVAEVGVWNSPLAPDPAERKKAFAVCCQRLATADLIGARCCVNIGGSLCRKIWCGPDPANLTPETFDAVVEVTRNIIDAVKPTRTFYTLEAMPWVFPDSPESYLDLIRAIDRPAFAVHLDPVNFIVSPRLYFRIDDLLRECFRKLGPHIKSCHAKDVWMHDDWVSVCMEEVRPGLGAMNYPLFLRELAVLPGAIPLMLEHLRTAEEYHIAGAYLRDQARQAGVALG